MKWWFPWFLLNVPTPAALLLCRPPFPASVLQLRNPQPPDTRPWPGCPQAAQKGQVPSPAVPKPGSQSSCLRNHLLVYRSERRGAVQSPPSSGPCSLPLIHSLLFTHPHFCLVTASPKPGPLGPKGACSQPCAHFHPTSHPLPSTLQPRKPSDHHGDVLPLMALPQGPLQVSGQGWGSGQGLDQHHCAACRPQTPGQMAPGGLTPLGPRAPPRPRPHPPGAGQGESGPPEFYFPFLGLGQGQGDNRRADGPRWASRLPPGDEDASSRPESRG